MVSSGAVVAQYFETEGVSHFIHVNRYLIQCQSWIHSQSLNLVERQPQETDPQESHPGGGEVLWRESQGPIQPWTGALPYFFCNNSCFDKCGEWHLGIFVCCSSFNSCIDMGTDILNSGDRPILRVGGEDELGRWKRSQGTRALLLVRGILQGGTIRTSGQL